MEALGKLHRQLKKLNQSDLNYSLLARTKTSKKRQNMVAQLLLAILEDIELMPY